MSSSPVYHPDSATVSAAYVNAEDYAAFYRESVENPDTFWATMAENHLKWRKRWDSVSNCSFVPPIRVSWFEGGQLNVCENCVDRHLPTKATKPAIIWEPDDPTEPTRTLTYQELHDLVCQVSNTLAKLGVTKGDRVCIYMPMVPEAAAAMLACARIGAIHTVVFAGFSSNSLKERMQAAACKVVITASEGERGGRVVPLKATVDEALNGGEVPSVQHVLVLRLGETDVPMEAGRDVFWHTVVPYQETEFAPVPVESTHPLFILYTSGSTGKPKGVVHGSGGYLLYAAVTHKYIFDAKDDDVYWCSADIGWITGHSYVVYGPLANGVTSVMFEGVPQYPTWGRFWDVIDKHKVSIFYTAPTAIRAIQAQGDEHLEGKSLESLRILGSVGEPINPEAWEWFYRTVGKERCPIVDTWWQTETGGILISPLPGATALKPGSATLPFFGVQPVLLDDHSHAHGHPLEGAVHGNLCIAKSWPGQMQTVWGDHERFYENYFKRFHGYYFSSDGSTRDEDGYYWITGRVDDVINVAGHRLSTAEIESALVLHPAVSEAAVVGVPHPIKGEGIYAFVTLHKTGTPSEALKKELIQLVRKEIGAIASPDALQWAPALPKTRSGKIMRRILRKIVHNQLEELGDISTLADPSVVEDLAKNRIAVEVPAK